MLYYAQKRSQLFSQGQLCAKQTGSVNPTEEKFVQENEQPKGVRKNSVIRGEVKETMENELNTRKVFIYK